MTMHSFQYFNPVSVSFGAGFFGNLSPIVGSSKVALITTRGFVKRGVVDRIKNDLGARLMHVFDGVVSNPTFDNALLAYNDLSKSDYDLIIGLGGGSVLDMSKMIAAMDCAGTGEWLYDHLKGGKPFPEPFTPKPVLTIPTTAGSGSEVTMWSSVWDMEEKRKYSVSHPKLYPAKAIVDPELTVALPEQQTIYSALDAFSHSIEAVWNKNHNPVSDSLALKAINIIFKILPQLKNDLANLELRSRVMQASVMAGLAFSNTQTAMAHAISYPLTSIYGIPHGLACSLPLPHLVEANASGMPEFSGKISHSIGSNKSPEGISSAIENFFIQLGVETKLSSYGIKSEDSLRISEAVLKADRFGNNVAKFTEDEVGKLIKAMI